MPEALLDLTGVACPLNAARALLKLETLAPGDILEIIIDDGEPRTNVPPSLEEAGHTVVLVEQRDDSRWRLLIRRG